MGPHVDPEERHCLGQDRGRVVECREGVLIEQEPPFGKKEGEGGGVTTRLYPHTSTQ